MSIIILGTWLPELQRWCIAYRPDDLMMVNNIKGIYMVAKLFLTKLFITQTEVTGIINLHMCIISTIFYRAMLLPFLNCPIISLVVFLTKIEVISIINLGMRIIFTIMTSQIQEFRSQ